MTAAPQQEPQPARSRLPFVAVFGVLFAFWVAIAVCVAAIVIDSAWDARDGAASVAAPTATLAPAPTATPEARPPGVPSTAAEVEGDFDSGEPEQHLFFNLLCEDDVLRIVTTDERVFAETGCPPVIDPIFVEPFRGDRVRITVTDAMLDIVTIAGERLTFPVARVWVERP
jgi:hypothetical protein